MHGVFIFPAKAYKRRQMIMLFPQLEINCRRRAFKTQKLTRVF